MFSGNEQDVPEALLDEMACLGRDLLDLEGDAEDGVVPGESAVSAVVHTLVGKVERGKESHRPTEVPTGESGGLSGTKFQLGIAALLKHARKAQQSGRGRGQRRVNEGGKAHEMIN
jgi:hypothetical protein